MLGPPSLLEAKFYYSGLFSNPRLIARTGAPWDPPTGLEPYLRAKELRIPGEHKLHECWEDNIALKVHDVLNQHEVNWSSTDIVRIAYVDEPSGNLILWIGVRPRPTPLSYEIGIKVALECKQILHDHGIRDVDVELRESDIIQTVGPRLFEPIDIAEPTAILREPFTTTLGMTICAQKTPWAEGTAGFFLAVTDSDVNKLLLVTARHVLFPRFENSPMIEHSCNTSTEPRHNVLLLSETSFQEHLYNIQIVIEDQALIVAAQEARLKGVEGREDAMSVMIREDAEHELKKAKRKEAGLTTFRQHLEAYWSSDKSRILGHVIYAPPIIVNEQQYTQDIAVIEVEPSKIDPNKFPGNYVDLGDKYTIGEMTRKMQPNSQNARNFTWPETRLLKLLGTIPVAEMCQPKVLDENGEPCIIVLKRGRTTNLTVGRGITLVSYTRKYFSEDDTAVSKERAVIALDKDSGAFSAKGDSGSVVVDGLGRIAGILTGGSGATDRTDVTYFTPIDFIMEVIHKYEPLAKAYIKSDPL